MVMSLEITKGLSSYKVIYVTYNFFRDFFVKYSVFKNKCQRSDSIANNNSHYFSRHLSTQCAYVLYKVGMSPNFITFLFLVFGFGSALSLNYDCSILTFILWRFHIILDMADGNVARATQSFSKSAIGFDRSNHIIINTTLILLSSRNVDNIFTIIFLIVSFNLYYQFSRNYYSFKQNSQNYSLTQNIIKDFIGLEGYIFITCSLNFLNWYNLQEFIIYVYILTFSLLYLVKLHNFIENNRQ
jgi:phosphatidylglycerophosphate synthase